MLRSIKSPSEPTPFDETPMDVGIGTNNEDELHETQTDSYEHLKYEVVQPTTFDRVEESVDEADWRTFIRASHLFSK